MAGSDLDTELRRNAEDAAEAILSAARADAERIASEVSRQIEERRRKVLQEGEAEYGARARLSIAKEKRAAMRALLLARTRVVERVLERVDTLLPEVAHSDTYLSGLGGELTEALRFVDTEEAIVRCSEALAGTLRDELRDAPSVRVVPEADIGTGFIVVGGGRPVIIDGRLETRIERLASMLAIEIHARLKEIQ